MLVISELRVLWVMGRAYIVHLSPSLFRLSETHIVRLIEKQTEFTSRMKGYQFCCYSRTALYTCACMSIVQAVCYLTNSTNCCFSLSFMIANGESLGFGLQKKQFKEVTLGSGEL